MMINFLLFQKNLDGVTAKNLLEKDVRELNRKLDHLAIILKTNSKSIKEVPNRIPW